MLCFPRSDGAQLGVPQWGESLRQTGESKSPSGWGIPDPESSKRLGRRQALWGGVTIYWAPSVVLPCPTLKYPLSQSVS